MYPVLAIGHTLHCALFHAHGHSVKEPVLVHWAKQIHEICYRHKYTFYAVQSFTFLRRTKEICKNVLCFCYKNVSFALLDGWNVTKTSFDHAWAGIEGSCELKKWTLGLKLAISRTRTADAVKISSFHSLWTFISQARQTVNWNIPLKPSLSIFPL